MDTKLATYRSKKRKKAMIEFAKYKFKEILSWKKIFNSRSQETPNSEDEVSYLHVFVMTLFTIE